MKKNLPELLAPAGSPEALNAAIAAGADAVYFGAAAFNARMNAKNFSGDILRDSIKLCKDAGVKTNITVNTLVHNREMPKLLETVDELYEAGADALIVADLGAAYLIHEYFPGLELHASTQAAGHNLNAAKELSKLGFSRMVAARELPADDIKYLCENSPIETEIFIHGAICVSQSGQCLASSLIGGRSGNRGECAQPCRLLYKNDKGSESPALSLKDICLAGHIPEILKLGVTSLKIEGRMKSPDYVYGVTSIYRRLIDENRGASGDEIDELANLFSRSGFTDGYYNRKINAKMLGVRTDSDKKATKALRAAQTQKAPADYKKLIAARIAGNQKTSLLPVTISASVKPDEPIKLTMSASGQEITVTGQIPEKAENRPLTKDDIAGKLTKLGGTKFVPGNIEIDLGENLILPLSSLNKLRRDAVESLSAKLSAPPPGANPGESESTARKKVALSPLPFPLKLPEFRLNTARVEFPDRGLPAPGAFDIIFVPLEKFEPGMKVNGVIIPPVVFDSERSDVMKMLQKAKDAGIDHALVSNPGHLALAKEAGMRAHGDFRLNIYNNWTAKVLLSLGFGDLIASPELTIPQLNTLGLPAIIYGRIPLMTLEKCCIRDLYSCEQCKNRGFLPLIDRKNVTFPLTRAYDHRNILYNSVPVYMADRKNDLSKLPGAHFIFTDESPAEVLKAYNESTPPKIPVRRIAK